MEKTEIIKHYKDIIASQYGGNPPTFVDLKKKHPSLIWQIESHGGYLHIKKMSGFDVKERKSPNYWTLDQIQKHVALFVKNNKLPTINTLQRNFGYGLVRAINKIGGMKKVASFMGYELGSHLLCSDGHHVQSSYEYLLDEFLYHHKIQHDVGGIICDKYNFRYDFKIGNIYVEIWGYNSGNRYKSYAERRIKKEKLYNELNLNLVSLEADWFKSPLIENKFKKILKMAGVQPSKSKFPIKNYVHHTKYWNYKNTLNEFSNLRTKLGRPLCFKDVQTAGLQYAISKFGGLFKFNDITKNIKNTSSLSVKHIVIRQWDDKSITQFLKQITSTIHHFPTSSELKELGYTGLLTAIEQHGKINKFREILGCPVIKKSHHYWSEDRILAELKIVIQTLGRSPKTSEINKSLCSAIYNNKKTIRYFTDKLCR
jgi:hypothetical protein